MCLGAREYRQGGELVEDGVQAGLRAELGEIRRMREEMVILTDTIHTQLTRCKHPNGHHPTLAGQEW